MIVLIPGIGRVAGGARRWIPLGIVNFQPAELAKVALVLYLARSLARQREKVRLFSIGFLPHVVVTGVLVVLCLAERDMGTGVIMVLVLFVMLFAAGARTSYLIGGVLLAIPIGWRLIAGTPYRMERWLAYLDPWGHRDGTGFQLVESLLGIGNGGWIGQGLGQGKGKLFYLPAAHTDFIAAVIAEEAGLLGIGVAAAALRAGHLARPARRPPRRRAVRRLRGARPDHAAGRPGPPQPGGGLRPAPDQGADPALRLLRRQLAHDPAGGDRHPALHLRRSRRLPAAGRAGGAGGAGGRRGGRMRLLIAGGGTGGHVFPGLALAEEVVTRHPGNDAVFVGTARGLEAHVVPAAGFPIELIEVKGLKGKGLAAALKNLLLLPRAFLASLAILRRWRPDVVVGVGGYASGPLVLAAWAMRIPTAVQEQNAVAGFTNRLLGRLVTAGQVFHPDERGSPIAHPSALQNIGQSS